MSKFIRHPLDKSLINTSLYWDIRCCTVNVTHVDFYLKPLKAGKRGKPSLTVVLDDQKKRDAWFEKISKQLEK